MKLIHQCKVIFLVVVFLFSTASISVKSFKEEPSFDITIQEFDCFLVSTKDPYYSIISTPLACSYKDETQNLYPMLLVENQKISSKQSEFISKLSLESTVLSIGCNPNNIDSTAILGSAINISHLIATNYFSDSTQALILPYNDNIKTITSCLTAAPLASYLNIPIILYDDQQDQGLLQETLDHLEIRTLYTLDDFDSSILDTHYEMIIFNNISHIQQHILQTIKEKFQTLNYITITNPSDTKEQQIIKKTNSQHNFSLHHNIIYFIGKKIMLSGEDSIIKKIMVPKGIHELSIKVSMRNTTSIFASKKVPSLLSATLTDPFGNTVAYAYSPGYEHNQTFLETIITNLSGEYTLTISLFHGFRGGYFSLRGLSNVNTMISINETVHTLSTAHYPFIKNLSLNAAYLTSAHGGIIVADPDFSLFDEAYDMVANHHGTGPWYDDYLHEYNNEKVEYIIKSLSTNLRFLANYQLLDSYLSGPAWLALLGDSNMIPMYYYSSNQTHLAERGLPSDNPYSLNQNLSLGRIISYTASDTSVLIARTLFYDQLCGIPQENDGWHNRFNFVFGEGFGETGGVFHQIPYANTIESYGFDTTVYGDLRNSRQAAERNQVYTDTNFVEYLGHGDWYWFTPSLYGFNSVGQSIGSCHIRSWEINRPNVVLTSACLMGRIDGVSPYMSVALSFLSAGSNAFIGATRETGQEAGLEILENHLIFDDLSIGEALRGEKRVDKVKPTYYVRCLFGDPAFNPYDPLHGFSDQGTPFI